MEEQSKYYTIRSRLSVPSPAACASVQKSRFLRDAVLRRDPSLEHCNRHLAWFQIEIASIVMPVIQNE